MAPSFHLNTTKIIHKSASTSCCLIGVDGRSCRITGGGRRGTNFIMMDSSSNDAECGGCGGAGDIVSIRSKNSSSSASLLLARSTSCTSVGLPVTPDSVLVGTNIQLLDGSHGGQVEFGGYGAPLTQPPSTSSTSTSSSLSSAASTQSFINTSTDDDDASNQQLLLNNMLASERNPYYHVVPDYLHSSAIISPAPLESKDQGVSERCRRRTCEWMYDICDHFQLQREVVGIALHYVDRYFTITFGGGDADNETSAAPTTTSSTSGQRMQVPVTRKEFQLVALTGLYIAVKLHGASRPRNNGDRQIIVPGGEQTNNVSPPNSNGSRHQFQEEEQQYQFHRLRFSVAVCASISRSQFTSQEIERCEMKMLNMLHWYVNPIVPSGSIIDLLLLHLPTIPSEHQVGDGSMDNDCLSVYVYDCAKYLAELSVSVPALCLVYKPSILAYSSILYALETILDVSTSNNVTASFKLLSSSSINSPSKDSLSLFPATYIGEYEARIHHMSSNYFKREKEYVHSAKKIFQTICPNLGELIMPSSSMLISPTSPVSVKTILSSV